MLFLNFRHRKEELQDRIDDIDMEIYHRKCELEEAASADDLIGAATLRGKMEELYLKREKLEKKLSRMMG